MNCDRWNKLSKTRYDSIGQIEVMEALSGNEEIRDGELMGMRWVVMVKQFQEKKVKARMVNKGFQARDLEDELLEAATPTPTRRAKHS